MNNNKINTIVSLTAVTVLLITAVTLTALDQAASAHKHHNNHYGDNDKQTQSLAQANNSGNGVLPLKVFSQNSASQVQGKDNIVNVSGQQA
jgi:hypothetical protein